MNDNKKIDKKFYEKTLRPDRQRSYKIVCDTLVKEFSPKSVVDFGCGAGWILHYFNKLNVTDLKGLEICKDSKLIASEDINEKISFMSLSENIDLGRQFDLTVSFEVAEHIDEIYADVIVKNLCRHSKIVVFSAAYPGQGGYGHINEQEFSYWRQKFEKEDFLWDETISSKIKSNWKKKNISMWYWKNTNIFRKEI